MKQIYKNPHTYFVSLIVLFISSCGNKYSPPVTSTQGADIAYLATSGGNVYDFGNVLLLNSLDATFTVLNEGIRDATAMSGNFYLSTSFAFKGGQYPGTGGTCGQTLAPKQACTIIISYVPRIAGMSESVLELTYFNGTETKKTKNPLLRGNAI